MSFEGLLRIIRTKKAERRTDEPCSLPPGHGLPCRRMQSKFSLLRDCPAGRSREHINDGTHNIDYEERVSPSRSAEDFVSLGCSAIERIITVVIRRVC